MYIHLQPFLQHFVQTPSSYIRQAFNLDYEVSVDSKIASLVAAITALPAVLAANDSFNLLCFTTTGLFGGAELYYQNGWFSLLGCLIGSSRILTSIGSIMISNATITFNMTSIYCTDNSILLPSYQALRLST